jgi:hypothetical protein
MKSHFHFLIIVEYAKIRHMHEHDWGILWPIENYLLNIPCLYMTQLYMNLMCQLNFDHSTVQFMDKLDRGRCNWLLLSTN